MEILFAGSFDPITVGHLDLIKRALKLFGSVTVGIFHNDDKDGGMFTPEERKNLVRLACRDLPGVKVEVSGGYVADFCKERQIPLLLRGIRSAKDLPFEQAAEEFNRTHGVETVFLFARKETSRLSSSQVRQKIREGGDFKEDVPPEIWQELAKKAEKL